MQKEFGHLISNVIPGSIADSLGVEAGDRLLSIDDHEIEDVLDYRIRINSESMVMLIEKPDGDQWELDIEHGYEDPGLEFESGLMSEYRSCMNRCIFCFIDQLPPGMRETLYFKDDDSRLSFLQGNYITLTNMKDRDIQKIIDLRLSPVNISVHTTNPALRCRMMNNRFAGDSLRYIDRLKEAGIAMNAQIVLCPGYNDGMELERTLGDMLKWLPELESVSVVPVGLTDYRKELCPIAPVTKELAETTLDMIEKYRDKALELCGMHVFHAGDELYLLAQRPVPEEEEYDGYLQLENGVGMLRLLTDEASDAISQLEAAESKEPRVVSIATGRLAFPTLREICDRISAVRPEIRINVYSIENDFFGHHITVSGLITGTDLIRQLQGKELGEKLLLPVNMFRSGEETFLDDLTREDVEKALHVRTEICDVTGYDLVDALTKI